MCERAVERLRIMSSQQEPRYDLCRYGLYSRCIYYESTRMPARREDCSLCLKAYRLKTGLVSKIEHRIRAEGTRTGVTL